MGAEGSGDEGKEEGAGCGTGGENDIRAGKECRCCRYRCNSQADKAKETSFGDSFFRLDGAVEDKDAASSKDADSSGSKDRMDTEPMGAVRGEDEECNVMAERINLHENEAHRHEHAGGEGDFERRCIP